MTIVVKKQPKQLSSPIFIKTIFFNVGTIVHQMDFVHSFVEPPLISPMIDLIYWAPCSIETLCQQMMYGRWWQLVCSEISQVKQCLIVTWHSLNIVQIMRLIEIYTMLKSHLSNRHDMIFSCSLNKHLDYFSVHTEVIQLHIRLWCA